MRLYIAEKPNLAKLIAAGIGKSVSKTGYLDCENGDRVTWCYGHMMEQAPPEAYGEEFKWPWKISVLPVVPKKWIVEPVGPKKSLDKVANEWLEKVGAHFNLVTGLLRDGQVTEIVHAGDPDREGQLIVDEILEHAGNRKPVLRIWLKALDPGSIRKAIAALDDNGKPLYRGLRASALARSRADWLVGMNMTRAVSSLAWSKGGQGVLTVGRVQTPVVKLVEDRNALIANFRPKAFFVPGITVAANGQTVVLDWKERVIEGVTDEDRRILVRKAAERLVSGLRGTAVTLSVKKERKEKSPPLPWTLSTLQVHAGKALGISPKEVDDVVQSLYDEGHVSYPRTECPYLPTSLHADAKAILPKLIAILSLDASLVDPSRRSGAFDDERVEAHYGIVPTVQVPSGFKDGRSRAIYEMISRVFLAQFSPPLVLAETSISVSSGEDRFAVSGKTVVSKGWLEIWSEGGPKSNSVLPNMEDGAKGMVVETGVREGQTTPPDPFTETSIIEVMKSVHKYIDNKEMKSILKESDGIGTVATRSSIVAMLIARGLLAKGKEKDPVLRVTPVGRSLLEAVPGEVADPVLTAMWERSLSEIEKGLSSDVDRFVDEVSARVSQWVGTLKSGSDGLRFQSDPQEACPGCGQPLFRRSGMYGLYWSHLPSQEDTCGKYYNDENGKPIARKERTSVRQGIPCPRCQGHPLMNVYKTSGGHEYFECGTCRARYWTEAGGAALGPIWDVRKKSGGGTAKSGVSSNSGHGKSASSGRGRK